MKRLRRFHLAFGIKGSQVNPGLPDSRTFGIAKEHAGRGERDRAFEWLERAFDLRDADLPNVKNDPILRKLHDDPRWKPFLRKMNLPVD